MKWSEKIEMWAKYKSWSRVYKKFKVKVSEGGTGFSDEVEFYWFSVNNEKANLNHNSLWVNGKYTTIEEAQNAALKWIDDKLKATEI